MLAWVLIACAAGVGWKFAEMEGRTGWPWGLATFVGAWWLTGRLSLLGPLAALVGTYLVLFALKEVERRRSGREF